MIVRISKSFVKELKKCPSDIREDILTTLEKIEKAESLSQIPNIKKLTGFPSYYRYKTGNWRVGMELIKDIVKICIIRTVLPRKEIYKHFPPK